MVMSGAGDETAAGVAAPGGGRAGNGFLDAVCRMAARYPDRTCVANTSGRSITYRELWDASDELACVLAEHVGGREPLMVYGHKSPLMPIAFLACMKSGHAYVPTDVHVPAGRVSDIESQLGDAPVLAVGDLPDLGRPVGQIGGDVIMGCLETARSGAARRPVACRPVSGDETQYIIFTSGSTGAPKGVEVTSADVANFMPWDQSLFAEADSPRVFLNQALLSFDLSVTELVGALSQGDSILALTADVEQDMGSLFEALGASGVTCWVSTPTFASVCLADPSFCEELLPKLTHFFFCGEPLRPDVVRRLRERFGRARVINAYGPTESTVAVTAGVVEPGPDDTELSVGVPRPGTTIVIADRQTGAELPAGVEGEVLICGDTVAKGYLNRPEKTAAAFGERRVAGRTLRCYRTGDLGRLDDQGRLWVRGRIDSQVKVHGYRIELGEVETALSEVEGIELVCAIVRTRHGVPDRLEAHVQLEGERPADLYAWGKAVRERLGTRLPAYMVPRRIVVDDELPVTPNGKVDRRRVMAAAGEA